MKTRALITTLLMTPTLLLADDGHVPRPDSHAPIGVMGDHTHSAGEVMLSYRFMRMSMEGNRDGTDHVDPQPTIESFHYHPAA